jgi:5,6,7,8-tetrahydromethanopterin hydro-lyase
MPSLDDLPGTQIGESFIGDGVDAAHVNTVLGPRGGPVETAWATALATPSLGHSRFVAVVRPGVPVQPFTLFVNKAPIEDATSTHARLTWGPAQAGVASGVAEALGRGVIDEAHAGRLLLIAAVWVDPGASDADAVFHNNHEATLRALAAGAEGAPSAAAFRAAAEEGPWNPFYRPRS